MLSYKRYRGNHTHREHAKYVRKCREFNEAAKRREKEEATVDEKYLALKEGEK